MYRLTDRRIGDETETDRCMVRWTDGQTNIWKNGESDTWTN